ncbi:hypothetical protein SERLA73DRAFT_76722 [Serpula lacrymans var. lacrymans S7.3]|uniref:Uncharacterized protein n=1 Tax=Serpula lacrymans var. lacrymans (strain S7.3) TaxID=936435 RepID=F8Q7U8_SERL3|nr:hypothetical protein SERLA73DRAFT_76722 [Serpula lacrymans var. lacrymans S7.3]
MDQRARLSHSAEFNPFRYMYTEQPVATAPYITSPAPSSVVPSAHPPFPAHHNSPTHYGVPQELTTPFVSQASNEVSPFAHRWTPPKKPPHMCPSIPPPWEHTMPAESSGQSHPTAVHPAQSSWSSLAGALGPPPQVAGPPSPPPLLPPPSGPSAAAATTSGTRRSARRGTIMQLAKAQGAVPGVRQDGAQRWPGPPPHQQRAQQVQAILVPKVWYSPGGLQARCPGEASQKMLADISTTSPPAAGQPGTPIAAPAVSNSETDIEGQSSSGELEYPDFA